MWPISPEADRGTVTCRKCTVNIENYLTLAAVGANVDGSSYDQSGVAAPVNAFQAINAAETGPSAGDALHLRAETAIKTSNDKNLSEDGAADSTKDPSLAPNIASSHSAISNVETA